MEFRVSDPALMRTALTARFSARSSAEAMALLKTLLRVTLTFDQSGDTTIVTLHPQTARRVNSDTPRTKQEIHTVFSTHREIGR
jgi:hypothetical protein